MPMYRRDPVHHVTRTSRSVQYILTHPVYECVSAHSAWRRPGSGPARARSQCSAAAPGAPGPPQGRLKSPLARPAKLQVKQRGRSGGRPPRRPLARQASRAVGRFVGPGTVVGPTANCHERRVRRHARRSPIAFLFLDIHSSSWQPGFFDPVGAGPRAVRNDIAFKIA